MAVRTERTLPNQKIEAPSLSALTKWPKSVRTDLSSWLLK